MDTGGYGYGGYGYRGYGYGGYGYARPVYYSSYGYSPYGYYQPSYGGVIVRPHYHRYHGRRLYCRERHRGWR